MKSVAFVVLVVVFFMSGCTSTITPPSIDKIAKDVNQSEIIVEKTMLNIGSTLVNILSYSKGKSSILYFRPHENETTSRVVVLKMINKYGGKFVELNAQGNRLIDFRVEDKSYTFDPNRIFSSKGISDTLQKYGKSDLTSHQEVDRFAKRLVEDFLTKNQLIALHNNTQGEPLSIKSYIGSKDALEVYISPNKDEDNFFYVTQKKDFDVLKSKDFNVILQDNLGVSDDGSMSVYCGSRGIRYINIEAQMGDESNQMDMLEALYTIL